MAYVPYQIPQEIDDWIAARAEKLTDERGKRVAKLAVLREMLALVEAVEALPVNGAPKVQDTQPAAQP